MIEGLGEPVKTYDAEEFKVKQKAISPFDFAYSINYTKEDLIVDDEQKKIFIGERVVVDCLKFTLLVSQNHDFVEDLEASKRS